jgi:lipopolysaccharide export system protein LptC
MNRSVLAAEFDDAGGQGWVGSTRPGLDRAFRAAARHSRLIRFLRVAVPALVAAVAVAVLVATWFSPARLLAKLPSAGGSLSSLGISGTKITMQLPRLEGFTRDGRPYLLTAKSALQDMLKPDNVELSDIHTRMERSDKEVVEMSAANGLYHSKADQLILRERIVLISPSYEAHLSEAVVDMRSGHVVSGKPVEVKLLNGLLNANGLEVEGDVIRFDGGVTLDMDGRALSSPGERSGK